MFLGYWVSAAKLSGQMTEAVAQKYSVKKIFLEISQNSQEKTCTRVSLSKLQAGACNFIKKETLAQVFSSEFCEVSKNTFSYGTPPVAASEMKWFWIWKRNTNWKKVGFKMILISFQQQRSMPKTNILKYFEVNRL